MTTTRRTIRIDDDTWRDWHIAANKAGVSRSVFIRDTMNQRLNGNAVVLAADVKPKRARTPKRTIDPASGMCEHRVSADAYCKECP